MDGTHSEAFILLDFGQKLILIGGTAYAGEIKKSIFTVMNYLLPQRNVMAMHCSANYGTDENDVAVFFGLSGTGKTTLSADPDRTLIGDDEHGWSDDGVFNFEGGCYAKLIRLSPEGEPEIYATTRQFGTVLENVAIDARTRHVNLDDASLTENTRGAYPITQIPNMARSGKGGHPKNIIMLTCDAFGVLPPLARLTPATGDVLLSFRIHREGGGHRSGRDGTGGDIQRMFRRAVHGAAAADLCAVAWRENCKAQRGRLAGQYRLERRPLRSSASASNSRPRGPWSKPCCPAR